MVGTPWGHLRLSDCMILSVVGTLWGIYVASTLKGHLQLRPCMGASAVLATLGGKPDGRLSAGHLMPRPGMGSSVAGSLRGQVWLALSEGISVAGPPTKAETLYGSICCILGGHLRGKGVVVPLFFFRIWRVWKCTGRKEIFALDLHRSSLRPLTLPYPRSRS